MHFTPPVQTIYAARQTVQEYFAAGEEEIFALRTGFRAKYIHDAARKVTEEKDFLENIAAAESYPAAESLLTSVKGVGPKVAACTLLFGFSRLDAFPVDVWMKRVLAFYPAGLPECFRGYEGIAQQYLFHWARNNL